MKKMKTILLAAAIGLLWSAGARADNPALTAPVKSVYGHYLKIQASLAKDSLTGVAENADAIAKAVQTDAKSLPAAVATEAETLAKASDLKSARAAFKPLSDSLIQYLADHKAKDAYVQVYCPMARRQLVAGGQKREQSLYGKSHVGVRGNPKLNPATHKSA